MTKRELLIDKYFINSSLEKDHLDIYYVRKSIFQALKSALPKFTGTVLDVGCGIMPYKEFILQHNSSVSKYIGLDYESSIEPEYALGKPDLFWKGDVIPLEDNVANVVMATELFEHCPEPEMVMKEMIRVLKPGGMLFYTVPFLWNLHLVPYDEYRYTPFSLRRHLANAGFANIEMQALGGLDASLAQMLGIWYNNRLMRPSYKKYLGKILIRVIKRLVETDARFDRKEFKDGTMITGLSGVAYKR